MNTKEEKTNKETTDVQIEGVTADQLASWKDKWGSKLRVIELPLDDDNQQFFTVVGRIPDRKTLSEWEKWSDRNPDKAKDILITNSLLTGVERVKSDDELFLTCATALLELTPIRKAIIKKL